MVQARVGAGVGQEHQSGVDLDGAAISHVDVSDFVQKSFELVQGFQRLARGERIRVQRGE